ncbi:glucose 1-dehydrogenase [Kutzneria viridogrisea]|uniref:Short-chain dehydrogenase/reductase family oxidoreductase n=2 Tax=Kutzneria TaxID=43356 RepID=W5W425_9PSEU|nr:short-chain dehydrogenase/reductase family oxidoreductase [Kutzneria albida DSM 43870]MBA8927442.1 NAD(P)-dependent dehydrogenase (short-subunit alcohol dehydrogenase family) [Kutzneria viridogrisea]
MSRFTDKVVLVSGAGSGLGRAAALAFAAEGASVVLTGRSADTLAETASAIEAAGGKALVVTADVAVEEDVRRVIDTVLAHHGRLDVAFNNAGVLGAGPLVELDSATVDEVLATNVKGTWLALKHQIPQMVRQGGGAIVNMSSVLGAYKSVPGTTVYGAAKAAVLALTKGAALEHAADKVRINAVSPGAVGGPMSQQPGETAQQRDQRVAETVPVGRIGSAEEIAEAVLWLASDQASYVTGQDVVLDGASSL